ncbi:MAG: hypothetical protein GY861_09105 [bacterium]|nr:hypothetical protein [bacterium]
MNIKILNTKEVKEIRKMIKDQWDAEFKEDYVFLQSTNDHIFIISRDVSQIDFEKIRMNSMGLYIAELKNDELRLNIEGSQLIGPLAKKNVVEVSDEEAKLWLAGKDLSTKLSEAAFVILKNKNVFIGCGRVKENKILNFISKARRVNSL